MVWLLFFWLVAVARPKKRPMATARGGRSWVDELAALTERAAALRARIGPDYALRVSVSKAVASVLATNGPGQEASALVQRLMGDGTAHGTPPFAERVASAIAERCAARPGVVARDAIVAALADLTDQQSALETFENAAGIGDRDFVLRLLGAVESEYGKRLVEGMLVAATMTAKASGLTAPWRSFDELYLYFDQSETPVLDHAIAAIQSLAEAFRFLGRTTMLEVSAGLGGALEPAYAAVVLPSGFPNSADAVADALDAGDFELRFETFMQRFDAIVRALAEGYAKAAAERQQQRADAEGLRQQLATATAELGRLRKQAGEQHAAGSGLQAQLGAAATEVTALKQQLGTSAATAQRLQAEANDLRKQLGAKDAALQRLTADADGLRKQLAAATADADRQHKARQTAGDTIQARLVAADAEVTRLQQQLGARDAALQRLQADADGQRQRADAAAAELQRVATSVALATEPVRDQLLDATNSPAWKTRRDLDDYLQQQASTGRFSEAVRTVVERVATELKQARAALHDVRYGLQGALLPVLDTGAVPPGFPTSADAMDGAIDSSVAGLADSAVALVEKLVEAYVSRQLRLPALVADAVALAAAKGGVTLGPLAATLAAARDASVFAGAVHNAVAAVVRAVEDTRASAERQAVIAGVAEAIVQAAARGGAPHATTKEALAASLAAAGDLQRFTAAVGDAVWSIVDAAVASRASPAAAAGAECHGAIAAIAGAVEPARAKGVFNSGGQVWPSQASVEDHLRALCSAGRLGEAMQRLVADITSAAAASASSAATAVEHNGAIAAIAEAVKQAAAHSRVPNVTAEATAARLAATGDPRAFTDAVRAAIEGVVAAAVAANAAPAGSADRLGIIAAIAEAVEPARDDYVFLDDQGNQRWESQSELEAHLREQARLGRLGAAVQEIVATLSAKLLAAWTEHDNTRQNVQIALENALAPVFQLAPLPEGVIGKSDMARLLDFREQDSPTEFPQAVQSIVYALVVAYVRLLERRDQLQQHATERDQLLAACAAQLQALQQAGTDAGKDAVLQQLQQQVAQKDAAIQQLHDQASAEVARLQQQIADNVAALATCNAEVTRLRQMLPWPGTADEKDAALQHLLQKVSEKDTELQRLQQQASAEVQRLQRLVDERDAALMAAEESKGNVKGQRRRPAPYGK